MKKIFCLILVFILSVVPFSFSISAEQDVTVSVNDKLVELDQPPVIIDGRTLVPIRAIMEAMGATVTWRERSGTAFINYNDMSIAISIGDSCLYASGEEIPLDVPARIINNRMCIPIRAVSEAFYCHVEWDASQKCVIITEADNSVVNVKLIRCIGETKSRIVEKYEDIVDATYFMGGKYYIHNSLTSEFFYTNSKGTHYNIIDDLDYFDRCEHICATVIELFPWATESSCSIDELVEHLGDYKLINELDNDFYPECKYIFTYKDYDIIIISEELNPVVKSLYVFRKEK